MEENFTKKVPVKKDEFIEAWRKDREDRKHREPDETDEFDRNHFERHKKDRPNTDYYRVVLTEIGVHGIVLPHHGEDIQVVQGGEPIDCALSKHLRDLRSCDGEPSADEYSSKIRGMMQYFSDSDKPEHLLRLGCMFVYDDLIFTDEHRELNKHRFQDHGKGKLYAANFHRFAAYGLWVIENGYKPIEIYYCTQRDFRDWR